MKSKELTTTQAAAMPAELWGESGESTVRLWFTQGHFPGAHSLDTPRGPVWLIPESDLKNFKKPVRGRPRKLKPVEQEKSAA